jgi:hypothetical protein
MKYCLINQGAGLGDIIFCQKIAVKIKEKYNIPVIWPVIKEYLHIKDYITNDISFVDYDSDFIGKEHMSNNKSFDNDEILYLALHCSSHHTSKRIMESKYENVGLSHHNWLDYFNFNRNKNKENELFYDVLKLKDDEEYIFVNRYFSSPPNVQIQNLNFPSHMRKIEMEMLEGFSVFDWCKVIENASGIYTTDTCIILFLEKLNLKTSIVEMTSRRPGYWGEIDYILKKPFKKMN